MEDVVRIVLGLEAHDLAVEVMDFLDRSGRARVVATAGDGPELARAVRHLSPDAVVASAALARSAGPVNGSPFLAVETAESVPALREAVRAGARGFFLWPGEREELAGAIARLLAPAAPGGRKRGAVIAVYGPRGGVGTTFLATHLARAFARAGRETALVDVDPLFGDVSGALGVPPEPEPRTVADLLPVLPELSARHVAEALWEHPEGFRALLAPADPNAAEAVDAAAYRAVVAAIAGSADAVVLHVPRGLDERARAALEAADRIVVVLSLDVLAFRDGRRALEVLARLGLAERCELVVNRAARGEIVPADVERAFGRPPAAVVGVDRRAGGAQDRGRLLPPRSRAGRAIARLAARVLEGAP